MVPPSIPLIQFEFSVLIVGLIQSLCYFHYLFNQIYFNLRNQSKALLQLNLIKVYHYHGSLQSHLH